MPLTSLPVEIQTQIVRFVNDTSTLEALRLSCHSLEVVATQELFKTAILYHNLSSCGKLEKIIGTGLAGTIRTILIRIWDNQGLERLYFVGSAPTSMGISNSNIA
ncbi:hypothetical protein ASPWEDRAFT_506774 [Aspergillus wentii DTO 134E9]|uniref:F-box domain-containing protein n=1 Tax=Aspergillus wentii DTO 134E9 TaxID=1073089 RepID=A0A1L9RKD5_ASPWE|nr:uncharacterized protein ASPWEDRAFT_506774 [Aspergillus wentii DTO 134E9]OJJ35364.1 hypothetical protein ASPWEDRAFT_506774 [Aspergillus wentii DTO 134E9]